MTYTSTNRQGIKLLKDFRVIHGFTQKEASNALVVYSVRTIENCEQGRQKVSKRMIHTINEYNKHHRKRKLIV